MPMTGELLSFDTLFGFSHPTTFKRVSISVNASTTGTIVAAVAGKKIRAIHYVIASTVAAITHQWKDDTPTNLSGAMSTGAFPISFSFLGGLFETAVGKALQLTVGAGGNMNGYLVYIEV